MSAPDRQEGASLMTQKLPRILAILANLFVICAGIVLLREARGPELLPFIALFFALPVLNLVVMWGGIDPELRRLERKVKIAELEKKLKELK